jgi:low temperature requirement protein LtrA
LLFALPLAAIFLIALSMLVSGLETGSAEYRSTIRYAAPSIAALILIVLGGLFADPARVVLWIAGLVVFAAGTIRAGSDEWIVRTGHFAERHGLIIIIALGEVIVALGNGVIAPLTSDGGVDGATVLTLIVAGALASLLWWSYFDRVQPAFEHRAEDLEGVARGRFVRDVYTYGHIPLVAGVVLIAVALEKMTAHPTDELPFTFRMIGAAGIVMFFGGVAIGVFRSFGVVARERLVAVAVIVGLMTAGGGLDGLVLFVAVDVIVLAALIIEHLRIERPAAAPTAPDDATV